MGCPTKHLLNHSWSQKVSAATSFRRCPLTRDVHICARNLNSVYHARGSCQTSGYVTISQTSNCCLLGKQTYLNAEKTLSCTLSMFSDNISFRLISHSIIDATKNEIHVAFLFLKISSKLKRRKIRWNLSGIASFILLQFFI